MELTFPIIKFIDDVLPFVKDKPEFILAERPGYFIINYVVSTPTTFSNAYEKECRGITFNSRGDIIRRPYHKFFNIGEKPETQSNIISDKMMSNHLILEKLDGSMIAPFLLNGKIRFGTKMGITDIALDVERHVSDIELTFIKDRIDENKTPIFEWVSPTNRIVIEYPEPRLILTGVRDNFTGEYDSYVKMLTYRDKYPGLYIVAAYSPAATNFKEFMKTTKELQGQEGFVVRFLDGQMVKAKGDWYLKNHKSKDLVSKEHNVVRMILDETVDDILPSLTNDDIKYIEDLTKRLEVRLESSMLNLKLYIDRVIEQYGSDRKAIGLSDLKDKSAIFSYLNGQSVREIVVSWFRKMADKESTWTKL